jgi:carbon storage regulator
VAFSSFKVADSADPLDLHLLTAAAAETHRGEYARRMLIITRRPGEKIMLGDDVVIEVIEVSGSSVRVGIQAPKSLPVYREEIWKSVKAEQASAGYAGNQSSPNPPAGSGRTPS